MAKLEIDLVDTKTKDENLQEEETKRGILYDSIIVHNVPKAFKSENVWILSCCFKLLD